MRDFEPIYVPTPEDVRSLRKAEKKWAMKARWADKKARTRYYVKANYKGDSGCPAGHPNYRRFRKPGAAWGGWPHGVYPKLFLTKDEAHKFLRNHLYNLGPLPTRNRINSWSVETTYLKKAP